MKCISCDLLSLSIICKKCQTMYLQPKVSKQEIITNFFSYSFYSYEDIKELIYTKYDAIGSQIYKILAKNSFKLFANEYSDKEKIHAIGIDDETTKGYSHNAILVKALESKYIQPLYARIRSTNNIKFANKDYAFRLQNPRNFIYKKPLFKQNISKIILVDDLITSGLTMLEAKDCITRANMQPLYAMTLCNLQN